MKILFVHNRYQNLGGEDLAAKVEMELIKEYGHTTELFATDNAKIAGFTGKAKAALGTAYSLTSKKRLSAAIRAFRPDIVHVFNFFPLFSPSIHYACQEARVPVIQKLSNFRLICPSALLLRDGRVCEDCVGKSVPWPGILHACYRNSRAGSTVVAAMLATHCFLGTWEKAVDAYIARTNFSRDKLIQGGLPAEKIAIIPSFAPDPGCPADATAGFAFFAGRLSPEKGIATLLSAWDRLNGSALRLKVAGDGPLKDELTRRADGGRIEYLGALSRENVQATMREAAFLVFPSVCYENFPLAIVEAFAAGVPVIASGIGAMAEIIENGRTGLHFRAGDPDDLATKIEWIMGHPAEMARMRREARAEYLLKYTPERNYQLMMKLYERTIDAKCRTKVERFSALT
jgi:glycosyltransferase involved in cell wall biosynthesis